MSVATGVGKGAGRRVLPYEPFERARLLRGKSYAELGPTVERTIHRARRNGCFTRVGADIAACAIGMHPNDLWGSDWWA